MKTDHLKMLNDVHEFSRLFVNSPNLTLFLQNTAEAIARHLEAERCSIYIYDQAKDKLNMKASTRKKIESVKLSCRVGEGVVGKVLVDSKPIHVSSAIEKVKGDVKGSKQEAGPLIAMPVIQGINRIGVILAFRPVPFSKNDVVSLKIMASQLSTIIEEVRALMMPKEVAGAKPLPVFPKDVYIFVAGKPASGGYSSGVSIQMSTGGDFKTYLHKRFKKSFTADEFKEALLKTERQLGILQERAEESLPGVASLIFSAHLLMLKDEGFAGKITSLIQDGMNPPEAILKVGKEYVDIFSENQNAIIREKACDVKDLAVRLVDNLTKGLKSSQNLSDNIVIAEEMYPSDVVRMSADGARGIILLRGGITSHVAVLSRSLQLPMVIANDLRLLSIPDGTPLLVDGESGALHIHPSLEIIGEHEEKKRNLVRLLQDKDLMLRDAKTVDGVKVSLFSNVNLLSDLSLACKYNSDGIGLYRTEFPFLLRADFPTEEEQFTIYSKMIGGMKGKRTTFRTLDIGGDKILRYHDLKEQNPFLGFRSIRFTLEHPVIFKEQIRAILRAGVGSDLRIMFPMIASVEEFSKSKELVTECMEELDLLEIDYNKKPKLGIMVEIPSVIDVLDELAKEIDFFSVGTNDLMQFLLAVDRTNEKVQDICNPLHPSVIRTLKRIYDIAEKNNTSVSICGDIAHNVEYVAVLMGIGFRNFSVNPAYIPKIKQAVINISFKACGEMLGDVLNKVHIQQIGIIVSEFNKKWLPASVLSRTRI
jgi:phosphotransferase system enzyme I (PtsP)